MTAVLADRTTNAGSTIFNAVSAKFVSHYRENGSRCSASLSRDEVAEINAEALRALKAPRIIDALVGVIGPNVKAMQSMLFIKSEGKPGQAWHQDEFFIPTRDRSLTAV